MAYLIASLKAVFAELDSAWPRRDRRTDGWIGDSRHCPGTSDHCADTAGRVHAIDIDKDGINTAFVVSRLTKYPGIIRYVIWNRQIYHIRDNYRPAKYTGSNPHTDHIHVSAEHTDKARNYNKGYGIYPAIGAPSGSLPPLPTIPDSGFDYSQHVTAAADAFSASGTSISSHASAIASIRTLTL